MQRSKARSSEVEHDGVQTVWKFQRPVGKLLEVPTARRQKHTQPDLHPRNFLSFLGEDRAVCTNYVQDGFGS